MILFYFSDGSLEVVHLLPAVERSGRIVFVAGDESIAVLAEGGVVGEVSAGVEAVDLYAYFLEVSHEGRGGLCRVWVAGHFALAVEIFLLECGLYLVAHGLLLSAKVLELCLDASAYLSIY